MPVSSDFGCSGLNAMENHLKTLLLSRTSLSASLRIFGVLASFTGILLGGIYTKVIFRYLTLFYDQLFTVVGLNSVLQHIQTHTSTLVTMRSLPTMATYGLAYTACGFLFLHFAFKSPQKSRLAASFYLFIFLTCILLIVLGTLFPKLDITYKL